MQLIFLVAYAGFAYGFDELTYDWQAMRAEELAAPKQPVVKQKSWAAQNITEPLKNYIRDQLTPEVQFLEEKIATKAPKIAQDEAAYGHIKRVRRGSPEHESWKKRAEENFSYAVENPIILDVPERKYQEFDYVASSLIAKGNELTLRKKQLETELSNAHSCEPGKKENLRNQLAIVNLDLDSVNNAIDELPMLKAHMRMQAQHVRKNRLERTEKDIKHPTDRFISNDAFLNQFLRIYEFPYDQYGKDADTMIDYWNRKIHYADQSGLDYLYKDRDLELGRKVYHHSEKLLKEATDKYNDLYPRGRFERMWLEELTRLEGKRQQRAGVREPEKLKNWRIEASRLAEEYRKAQRARGW